jgi:hypothetical protein
MSEIWEADCCVSRSFLTAVPTAELEPFTETYVQADEVSTGVTAGPVRMRLAGACLTTFL